MDKELLGNRVLGSDYHLRAVRQLSKEEVDLYDLILSHLLDEGYAETQEAAEVMMVNMSEEWRDSIMEEVLDEERKVDKVSRQKGTPLTPEQKRSIRNKETGLPTSSREKLHKKQRNPYRSSYPS